MNRKLCFLMTALFLFTGRPVFAETGDQELLTLEDALRLAYVNHPGMREARQEISAAQGRWIQAEALPDPELELEIGGLKSQRKGEKEVRDGNIDSFVIRQPLDPLGTRFLRGRIGYDEVKISRKGFLTTWAEVVTRVTETYARILAQEKAVEVAQANLHTTRQFLTQVEIRFQSGGALKSDLLRAKIEVSRAENDLLVSQKELRVSRGEMNLLLGRPVETVFSLADTLSYEPLRYRYQNLTAQALNQRTDLQAEQLRLSSKKKAFWRSLLETLFPEMAMGVERTTEEYENDTALLLRASYPLWGFNLGEVREAKAEKEKQKIRLEALQRQVGLEVYQAFLEAELADKQVTLQKTALDEAGELLRQITVQYEEGDIPFLIYLENIKTIKETRLAYFNALKNYKGKMAELEKSIQDVSVPKGEKLP